MEILKIIGLIDNIETYQRIHNHAWRKHKSKIQNKKVDEMRNYLIEEINQNILMSKKHKKSCEVLNYIHHLLIVVSISNYWMYFHFCFCFFSSYSNRNYEFCNWIKNLCQNCRN